MPKKMERMKRFFSRGSSIHGSARTTYYEPGYNVPRAADIRPCQWPCEIFMEGAGIQLKFEQFVEIVGLTAFLADKCPQYHLLINTFVQNFKSISSHSETQVAFHLYNHPISKPLEQFCEVCKISYWGSLGNPCRGNYEEFLMSLCNGETRGVTKGRIFSIHFPSVHYFALLIGRCVTGKQDPSATYAPDLSILHSALYSDRTYNIGAVVVRRLSKNVSSDDIYGGIYASCLAAYFEIPIRYDEDHELPTCFIDFEAMKCHGFIYFTAKPNDYKYNLMFDMHHPVIITLPASTLFDHQGKERYYVTLEEAESHLAALEAARIARMNEQRVRQSFHQSQMREYQPDFGAGPSHYLHHQWD